MVFKQDIDVKAYTLYKTFVADLNTDINELKYTLKIVLPSRLDLLSEWLTLPKPLLKSIHPGLTSFRGLQKSLCR
jgi:hypothetical protein